MVLRPANCLSLCAGAGGLDMGLMLAEPQAHTRCFVEWDEHARERIIAAQLAGYFAPAPIWDDVTTFDGREMCGAIDTILAGYPCQPFSQAGQRKGEDDERHLWPDIARIIREIRPRWVFLENVAGHVSLGAETVLRELWELGFTPAAGLFSAEEVGAPHERLRWFCVAYKSRGGCGISGDAAWPGRGGYTDGGDGDLDDAAHGDRAIHARPGPSRGRAPDAGRAMLDVVHLGRSERRSGVAEGHEPNRQARGWIEGAGRTEQSGQHVDNAASPRCDAARSGPSSDQQGGQRLSGAGCDHMADTGSAECKGQQRGQRDAGRRQEPDGYPALPGEAGIFPPGPGDQAAWAHTLAASPYLAPATGLADCLAWAGDMAAALEGANQAPSEPDLRRMAHGLASRTRALRLLGNGVHPLAAAHAWRALAAAHGLGPVDLEAARHDAGAGPDEPAMNWENCT